MLRKARVPAVSLGLFGRPLEAVLTFFNRRIPKGGGGSDFVFGIKGRVRRIAFSREILSKVISRGKSLIKNVHLALVDVGILIHLLEHQITEAN